MLKTHIERICEVGNGKQLGGRVVQSGLIGQHVADLAQGESKPGRVEIVEMRPCGTCITWR